ncbi:uncharacterized protein LOC117903390 [Drosophila subobscura]|uniref:uncharacterized protein LOC117903390 n=1 Tax=Drosophila subobscura TaxID=7241 RepID=UPI00155A6D00|nr:uncharacterized protein LOC117903390 [Drosophila subobscura]
MPSKKRIGARRQAADAVPLSAYFSSSDEPSTSGSLATLGTIPSNGLSHISNVTPIVTPNPQDSLKSAATPPASVWGPGAAPLAVPAESVPPSGHSIQQSVAKWLSSVPTQIQNTSEQQLLVETSIQSKASAHESMNAYATQQVDPLTNLNSRTFRTLQHEAAAETEAKSQLSVLPEEPAPAAATANSGKAAEAQATTSSKSTNFQSRRRSQRQRRTFTAKDLMYLDAKQDEHSIMGNVQPQVQPQPLANNYYCSAPAPARSTATAAGPSPFILTDIPTLASDLKILPIETLLMPKGNENQPQTGEPLENCNRMASQQSAYRGTRARTTDTAQNATDGCGLPSSISGPSQASVSPSSWGPISEQESSQEPNMTSFSDLLQQQLMENSQSMDSLKIDQNTNSSASREVEWETGWNLSQGDLARDLMYSRPLLNMDLEDTPANNNERQSMEQADMLHSHNNEIEIKIDEADADAGTVDKPSAVARHQLFGRRPANETHPKPDLNFVPTSVKRLYQLICSQYSDYAFVYALSAQLSQECVPMDCYVYLKMVLLASIVSIEPDELRSPISLCIIATDSTLANRLMSSVGQFAPRFLGPHEGGLQATHSALPVRYTWVVASPLLMAQQGVYYAGDWTRLSREHSEQLEKSIENGTVPVPQIQGEQPLEAAIWTHWQPENAINQTVAFAKLCPIFGMPIYMGAEVSDSLWSFLLQQHSEHGPDTSQDALNIPEEELRMLLGLLHQRKATFGDAAQCLLQKYYVISRKERPTVFSSKTYIVLKQFAESFAKLAMRLEVIEADVIVAIFHCEHFVQAIFGGKDGLPAPSVETFSVISHIDPYMDEFARWLFHYLDQHSEELPDIHVKRRRTDSWEDME